MTSIPTVNLGDTVVYVGGKGNSKTAIVVNTVDSINSGTSLPELNDGQLHLVAWEWSAGHFVPKIAVPHLSQIAEDTEFQNDNGEPINYWKLPTE